MKTKRFFKKRYFLLTCSILLISFYNVRFAPVSAEAAEDNFAHIGKGCTTAYYIDKDCDGYGVGKRSDGQYGAGKVGNMPDADDEDPAVRTSVAASELDALLAKRGYAPLRKIFIDGANGDDANYAINQCTNINTPCKTWVGAKGGVDNSPNILPGTMVLFRAGIYPKSPSLGVKATESNPIVIMAYPGENVVFQGSTGSGPINIGAGSENIIVDGLIVDGYAPNHPSGDGFENHGIEISGSADVYAGARSFSAGDVFLLRSSYYQYVGSDRSIQLLSGKVEWIDGGDGVIYTAPATISTVDLNPKLIKVLENSVINFSFDLQKANPQKNIVLRNIESTSHGMEIEVANWIHSLTLEGGLFHNSRGSHTIYLGSHNRQYRMGTDGKYLDYVFSEGKEEIATSGVTVKGNIFYGPAGNGIFQVNGPANRFIFEENIVHSNSQNALQLYNGVSNSIVRNNVLFNNGRAGILLWNNYDDNVYRWNNLYNISIINNLILVSKYIPLGSGEYTGGLAGRYPAIDFYGLDDQPIHNITIKNNILYTRGGASVFVGDNSKDYMSTNKIENNLIFNTEGQGAGIIVGGNWRDLEPGSTNGIVYSFAQMNSMFGSNSNVFGNPLFANDDAENWDEPWKFDFDFPHNSPAVDIGTSIDAPGYDLRGVLRPQGVAYDAGCYEYASGAPPVVLYGDVSGDGEIRANDASLAAQYAVGLITLTPEQVTRANVSGDDEVSAADASLIAQKAVDLIDKFPVEE